jgi:hypothetical protein
VWSWPGNTGDQALIRQVRDDLREWTLSKIVWVADRGFTSAANRRALMRGGGGYIIGEKLRTGSPEVRAVLSRQGRYATVRDNLQVKEVNIGTDDRFVICFNPDQATRDAAIRERMVTQLTEAIEGTDKLPRPERDKLAGVLSTKPGLKRFLRTTPGGLLRVDKRKIAAEASLDGKYLLPTACRPLLPSTDCHRAPGSAPPGGTVTRPASAGSSGRRRRRSGPGRGTSQTGTQEHPGDRAPAGVRDQPGDQRGERGERREGEAAAQSAQHGEQRCGYGRIRKHRRVPHSRRHKHRRCFLAAQPRGGPMATGHPCELPT